MKKIFTTLFILGLSIFGFPFIQAQDLNTLVVNSPASVAGSYQMLRADWGSQSNNPIIADVVFAA